MILEITFWLKMTKIKSMKNSHSMKFKLTIL
jgi:hypothetical protein